MGAQHLEQDEMVIKNEIQRAKDRGKGGIQDLYSCGYKDGFHSMFKADGEAVSESIPCVFFFCLVGVVAHMLEIDEQLICYLLHTCYGRFILDFFR